MLELHAGTEQAQIFGHAVFLYERALGELIAARTANVGIGMTKSKPIAEWDNDAASARALIGRFERLADTGNGMEVFSFDEAQLIRGALQLLNERMAERMARESLAWPAEVAAPLHERISWVTSQLKNQPLSNLENPPTLKPVLDREIRRRQLEELAARSK